MESGLVTDGENQPAVLIARRNGEVIDQNACACELLGEQVGERCWKAFRALEDVEELPCQPGCAKELLNSEALEVLRHTPIVAGNRHYRLTCVTALETVVCLLTSRAGTQAVGWEKPTPRQHEVLRLLSQGQTTADIAEELGVRGSTVCTHIENLLTKFRARSRAGLVALAFRMGYLD